MQAKTSREERIADVEQIQVTTAPVGGGRKTDVQPPADSRLFAGQAGAHRIGNALAFRDRVDAVHRG